ncbi:MAG: HEAT repeat domain-containing protein, partial [Gemmataceae bacterium]
RDNLKHDNAQLRVSSASLLLQAVAPRDNQVIGEAVAVLREGLKDETAAIRIQAAHTLAVANRDVPAALPVLIAGVKDKNATIRLQAVQALARLGNQATPAVDALIVALQDKDAAVRQQAVWALQSYRGDAEKLMTALAPLLRDDNLSIRQSVVNILSYNRGAEAIPLLIQALDDQNEGIRQQALQGLYRQPKLDVKELLPKLKLLCKAEAVSVRQTAIACCARLGNEGLALVLEGCQDAEPYVRWSAAQALGTMRVTDATALQTLVDMALKDDNATVRNYAVNALNQLDAVDATLLAKLLESKDVNTRRNVLYGIARRGPKGREAVPVVLPFIKDDNLFIRQAAIHALGQIAPPSEEVLTALRDLTNDPNPTIRQEAKVALLGISKRKQ